MVDLRKIIEMLKKDGWDIIENARLPYLLAHNDHRVLVEIDPDIVEIHWRFKGYDSKTIIPISENVTDKSLVEKIKELVEEIKKLK